VQAIGLGAAIDYVERVGRERIKAHEDTLLAYAMDRLGELNWLRIFGYAKDRGSIISFEMEGAHPHDVSTILDRYGVAVRAGTHCAEPLLARFGVTSTARASIAMYNTKDEIDTLVEGLRKARELFA
jgi:cysteine desulfurase / selenocysteine lyase